MKTVLVVALMAVSCEVASASVQWAGGFGQVAVMSHRQPMDIKPGQSLAGELHVTTGSGSGAVMFQQPGSCIQIGEAVQMAVNTTGEPLRLSIKQGEVRAAVGARAELELRTALAFSSVTGSVVRTHAHVDRVVILVEQGRAEIVLTDAGKIAANVRNQSRRIRRVNYQEQPQDSIVLTSGQQIEIRPGAGFGNVTEMNESEWLINPDVWLVSISQNRSSSMAQNQGSSQQQSQTSPQDSGQNNGQNNAQNDGQGQQSSDQPSFNTQISTGSGVNLTLGSTVASSSFSGAAFSPSDANQDTSAGMLTSPFRGLPQGSAFPGVIHLVTGETGYTFGSVKLVSGDNFLSGGATQTSQYWSIGEGTLPLPNQIATGLGTGTSISPNTLAIPQFNGFYLVQLDQYPLNDSLAANNTGNPQLAVTGLVGQIPTGPTIQGGTPNLDTRAQINQQATFALGEFAVRQVGDNPQIAMRRSDQDRTIIKDPDGNDLKDQVTPNSDVTAFVKVPDNRFLPQNKDVFVPTANPNSPGQGALRNLPTYSNSNMMRKAAFTVLTAKELSGFSQRTGQTRFVVDGKIVDISGYRP